MHLLIAALSFLSVSLSAVAAQAQQPPAQSAPATAPATQPAVTLHIGDPAPPLGPGRWLKGEPVSAFEPGKVYVVEFWATWCGPCIAAIPHISDLQKQHAPKERDSASAPSASSDE